MRFAFLDVAPGADPSTRREVCAPVSWRRRCLLRPLPARNGRALGRPHPLVRLWGKPRAGGVGVALGRLPFVLSVSDPSRFAWVSPSFLLSRSHESIHFKMEMWKDIFTNLTGQHSSGSPLGLPMAKRGCSAKLQTSRTKSRVRCPCKGRSPETSLRGQWLQHWPLVHSRCIRFSVTFWTNYPTQPQSVGRAATA